MSVAIYSPVFYENFLSEFINYYTNIGVELFIFYIDDDMEKYIYLKNKANIILIPQDNYTINTQFLRHCTKILLEKKIDYILKVDCDEFLYINSFKNLQELIFFYYPFDCLKINWLMFSSNKCLKNDSDSIINTYPYSCQFLHHCTKSLTKVESIVDISNLKDLHCNSHMLPLKKNSIYKNILNEISDDNIITIINFDILKKNKIYIAHYSNQDFYTFLKKKYSSKVYYYWGLLAKSAKYDCLDVSKDYKILNTIEKIKTNFDDFYKYMVLFYTNTYDYNNEFILLNKKFGIENFCYEKHIINYFNQLDNMKIFNNEIIIFNNKFKLM